MKLFGKYYVLILICSKIFKILINKKFGSKDLRQILDKKTSIMYLLLLINSSYFSQLFESKVPFFHLYKIW